MTHELRSIDHYWSEDTLLLEFRVTEADEPKNLQGAEITWWLQHRGTTVLSLSDPGVSLVSTDPELGEFMIQIDRGSTENLGNNTYAEFLRIIDTQDNQRTYRADFHIEET